MSQAPRPFRVEDSAYAFVVHRPVAILMVTLAVAVFGYFSLERLPLTLMPDMSYPSLTVRTEYPGTAPEEVENVISRPLEQELGILPHLASISSISKAGQSDVVLEFQWDADMDTVAQEVREKVDRLRLPDGAQRPLLLHYDPSLDPILRIGLAGKQSLYELRHLAEHEVKRRLETVPGVAAVKVKGGLEEQYLVALDEQKLAALRLDINQVNQRIQQGNVNLPGGNLREGQTEYLIRTLNEFRSLEEIGSLIITRQNGIDIRLRDIGTVKVYHRDREVITRMSGSESVEMEIYKEADANVVSVAEGIRHALFGNPDQLRWIAEQERLRKDPKAAAEAEKAFALKYVKKTGNFSVQDRLTLESERRKERLVNTNFIAYQLPAGARAELLADQSVFIKASIDEVKGNAFWGGVIAVVVLYLFLRNLTQTLIVSLCIPISIIATFAPMHMAGVSLNIISLGGLALGVGNLVDNAIVVLESIFRCREEGDDPLTAVVRGTSEVGMPVIASTLTTVAVFFPIVFVEGVAGQVFGDMALTVVFSQIASLIAALFLIPMLAARQSTGTRGTGARVIDSSFLQFREPAGSRGHQFVGFALQAVGRTWIGLRTWFLVLAKTLLVLLLVAGPLLFLGNGKVMTPVIAAIGLAKAAPWVLALIKAVLSVVAAGFFLFPLAWQHIKHRRGGSWYAALAASAARDQVVGRTRVWPGVLAFHALESLGQDAGKVCAWCNRGPMGLRALKWLPGSVAFVFLYVRTIMTTVFKFVGSTLQVLLLTLGAFLAGIGRAVTRLFGRTLRGGMGVFDRGYRAVESLYAPMLAATLRHRFAVLAGSFAAFALCWFFVVPRIGQELIPQAHQGEFNLDLTLPIGTPLERTSATAARVESRLLQEKEVLRVAVSAGAEDTATASSEAGEHTARLLVKLAPGTPAARELALIDRIRDEFRSVPELKIEVSYPALFSFKSPIEVEILGHDLATLKRLSREAETLLSEVPGLVDVRSTLQSGHPEIQVVYKRDRLAEYGLNLRSVADLVRNKMQGREVSQFRREDRMIDIVVRLREEDRYGIDELRQLIVNPGAANAVPIPLSAIADLSVNEGPNEIRRIDQQRTALITANVRGADLATASRDIAVAMETLTYPAGFSYKVAGQNEEMRTSLNSLLMAFALALFLVYIVMASQFESLVQPLLIMMTVPLALIGVSLVLWLAGISISIMVFLGLITLAGIVVNNAIVLIDYINILRSRGMDKTSAIVEAGRARLRPILMTAMTTVVGLLPMAFGLGEGAEIRAPMAITVVVGLSTATLLTLLVIPTLYYQFVGEQKAAPGGPDDLVVVPPSANQGKAATPKPAGALS